MVAYDFYQQPLWFLFGLFVVLLWTMIWEGLGLWYAARNHQKGWFIAILLFNTLGLLPIIYLIWFKPAAERSSGTVVEVKPARKRGSRKK